MSTVLGSALPLCCDRAKMEEPRAGRDKLQELCEQPPSVMLSNTTNCAGRKPLLTVGLGNAAQDHNARGRQTASRRNTEGCEEERGGPDAWQLSSACWAQHPGGRQRRPSSFHSFSDSSLCIFPSVLWGWKPGINPFLLQPPRVEFELNFLIKQLLFF